MGTRQPNRDKVAAQLGPNLKEARLARGLTQAQVAEEIDVTFEFYHRCERSKTLPSVPTLARLAETLEVSVDVLLGFKPRAKPPGDDKAPE